MKVILLFFSHFFRRGNADEIINKYHEARTRYDTTREEFSNVKKNLQVIQFILSLFLSSFLSLKNLTFLDL